MTLDSDVDEEAMFGEEREGEVERFLEAWGRRGAFLKVTIGAGGDAVDMVLCRIGLMLMKCGTVRGASCPAAVLDDTKVDFELIKRYSEQLSIIHSYEAITFPRTLSQQAKDVINAT
jgi:hypothetical protein